jgi:hypothetical protein
MVILAFFLSTFCALYQHQSLNHSCPCVFDFQRYKIAGLGHKLFEIFIGISIAYEIGCTFVYESDFHVIGEHGQYKEVIEWLNVEDGEYSQTDWQTLGLESVQIDYPLTRPLEKKCRTRYHFRSDQCKVGAMTSWCLDLLPPALYRAAVFIATEKFYRRRNNLHPAPQLGEISVVWHIRVGDRNLRQENSVHYRNLIRFLQLHIASQKWRIVFAFECTSSRCENSAPTGYTFLAELCAGFDCVFDASSSVLQHLQLMIGADVLVTSGSSFSYAAAVYSTNIIIFTPNKMRQCPLCYLLDHYVVSNEDGDISPLEAAKFIALLRRKQWHTV